MANVPLGQAVRATRTVSAGIGPISWGYIDIGFLLCMLICLVLPWHCTIPVFLSFVNRVVKGGVVSVAAQAINSWAGALGGMLILVSYFLTAAISCLSAIQYFGVVVPAVLPSVLWITIGVLILLGILNWIGISESAKVSLVAALIAFGSDLALLWTVFSHLSLGQVFSLFLAVFGRDKLTPTSVLVGFAGAFLAFSGLESISQLSPVMKTPRKKEIGIALFLVAITIGITSPLLTMLSTILQQDKASDP